MALEVLTHSFVQITSDEFFKDVLEDILLYVSRDLTDEVSVFVVV